MKFDPPGEVKLGGIKAESAYPLLHFSWLFVRRHYGVVLPAVIISLILNIIFTRFWFLTPLSSLVTAGLLLLFRKLHCRAEGNISDLLAVIVSEDYFKRLIPYLVLTIVVAFMADQLNNYGLVGSLLSVLLSLVLWAMTAFSIPLILFHNVELSETIRLSVQATTRQWIFFLWLSVFYAAFMLVSLIALVLPFFLITIPVMAASSYFCYVVLYEQQSVQQLKATLGSSSMYDSV